MCGNQRSPVRGEGVVGEVAPVVATPERSKIDGLQGVGLPAGGSAEKRSGVLGIERWDAGVGTSPDRLCGTGPLPADGGMPGGVECGRREGEEGVEDLEPVGDRRVHHPRAQSPTHPVPRGRVPKNPTDFLSLIRTAINSYYSRLEDLRGDRMYDVELQRDMARDCVLEIDNVLSSWRGWRKAK